MVFALIAADGIVSHTFFNSISNTSALTKELYCNNDFQSINQSPNTKMIKLQIEQE
jgi:hypothetical protein